MMIIFALIMAVCILGPIILGIVTRLLLVSMACKTFENINKIAKSVEKEEKVEEKGDH